METIFWPLAALVVSFVFLIIVYSLVIASNEAAANENKDEINAGILGCGDEENICS